MFKPEDKVKVKSDCFLTAKGTALVVDKDGATQGVITGKSGTKLFCRVPWGGSLFYDPENLELAT